jgi:hypothetical protein
VFSASAHHVAAGGCLKGRQQVHPDAGVKVDDIIRASIGVQLHMEPAGWIQLPALRVLDELLVIGK